jgi:hypothetical protein
MSENSKITSFVGTLDEVLRFLESYQNSLFYFDINPTQPPNGARRFDITTFPPAEAERIVEEIHSGVNPPRYTPQAQTLLNAAKPTQSLEFGINIHPSHGHGWALTDANRELTQIGWVRFPFTSSPVHFNTLEAAFSFFDPVIEAYHKAGVKICLVLTHEMYGEAAGFDWNNMDSARWAVFSASFATVAERVIRRYGAKVAAFELWNEGDTMPGNPAAVHFPPADFARLLDRVAPLVKTHAPKSKLVLGGLVMMQGAQGGVEYVLGIRNALNGRLPLDAIGLHPYGKGAPNDRTVFSRLGNIGEDLALFEKALPKMPLWLTEVGALGTHDPAYWDDAALYMRNLYTYLAREHADSTPVVMWYALSDSMDLAQKTNGLFTLDGSRKPHLYDTFFSLAKRKA